MVIKCKLRGKVEVEEVSEQAYQIDDPSPSKVVVVVDTDIHSNICFLLGKVDIIKLPRQHSMHQADERGASTEDEDKDEEENSTTMLKSRVMKIVLNFQNNEMPSVLCLYLISICFMFSILCIYIYFNVVV